jgi:hypothetical protein
MILVGVRCSDNSCFGGDLLLWRRFWWCWFAPAAEWAFVFGVVYCLLQMFSGGGCWPVVVV